MQLERFISSFIQRIIAKPTNIEARVVNHKKTFERYLHSTYNYISFENHGELSNFKQEIRKIINVQIENFVGSVTVSKQYGSSNLFQCQKIKFLSGFHYSSVKFTLHKRNACFAKGFSEYYWKSI